MENVEIMTVILIMIIHTFQQDLMIQDQKVQINIGLEISKVAKKYVLMTLDVQLFTSSYLTQELSTIAGSGQSLAIYQMVLTRLIATLKMTTITSLLKNQT